MTILLSSAMLLTALLLAEFALERRAVRRREIAETAALPYSRWAYSPRSGARFAFWRGYLKLELHPALTYRNAPNQRTPYFSTNSRGVQLQLQIAAPKGETGAGARVVGP